MLLFIGLEKVGGRGDLKHLLNTVEFLIAQSREKILFGTCQGHETHYNRVRFMNLKEKEMRKYHINSNFAIKKRPKSRSCNLAKF